MLFLGPPIRPQLYRPPYSKHSISELQTIEQVRKKKRKERLEKGGIIPPSKEKRDQNKAIGEIITNEKFCFCMARIEEAISFIPCKEELQLLCCNELRGQDLQRIHFRKSNNWFMSVSFEFKNGHIHPPL